MSQYTIRGDRLEQLRDKHGLTQKQLAERLSIGEKEIWRYENTPSNPTAITLTKLAKFFNVSTDYLLGIETQERELSPVEKDVIDALRRGDEMEAVRIISMAGKRG